MCSKDPIMCPSNRCKPGSKLLGVREADGKVSLLPEALPIDEHFIESVSGGEVNPEQRFRFTNKCVEGGCAQWTGKGCGVIDQLVQYLEQIPDQETLPRCSIRPVCRWYLQKGADACRICPYVVTDITEFDLKGSEEKVM